MFTSNVWGLCNCHSASANPPKVKNNLLKFINKELDNFVCHVGDHQDAHEVLTLLLHCLEPEVSSGDLWPFHPKLVRTFRCTMSSPMQKDSSNCYDVEREDPFFKTILDAALAAQKWSVRENMFWKEGCCQSDLYPNSIDFWIWKVTSTWPKDQYLKVQIAHESALKFKTRYTLRAAFIHSGSLDFDHQWTTVEDGVLLQRGSDTEFCVRMVDELKLS